VLPAPLGCPARRLAISASKSLALRRRFEYKSPDTRMKNDAPSPSRRGSTVIQTMLARLAKEEEEWKQRKPAHAAASTEPPKAMAAQV